MNHEAKTNLNLIKLTNFSLEPAKMTQCVKALAAKPDGLTWRLRTHIVVSFVLHTHYPANAETDCRHTNEQTLAFFEIIKNAFNWCKTEFTFKIMI